MLIRTEGLTKKYKKRYVVNGVNIEVNKGEIVGLLGPNGAGKSTTFYMIVGLIKPEAGKVYIGSTDVTKCPTYERAKYGVGYLPQEPSIFRKLSVEDNIMAILETMDLTDLERKKHLDRLLDEFSITKLRKSMAYTLSGGERRRVEIARALVTNPSFLLLDEPFVGIDPITVADIQQVISQLKKKGLGILITDHNVRETLSVTDRAYIMYEGKILLSGDAKKLSTDKKAKEFYLGEKFTL
ncbi:MAG: LPS export ABC transporter ATP-binding protein [Candidatus Firestonebacteria bacterium RIFOXYC2_FULL_39_67]|nr:MAG: LPS export ABC transporter ATP-binding protein [Candidatus Firestonebacteria bacterium RIFOXYD2_FULL_39_29]OGF52562.1 MAG: LPS export ABC transporter ATP-binding protein [Candidatus Firestonebacteria bacterium RifOxyC12_full_39_7]OGF55015.1 MAG: LPS export ABC transporter ATP-binding protein [Candidatus Firestonebacteria bacterium RIFOXYC2_FULL_39_67]